MKNISGNFCEQKMPAPVKWGGSMIRRIIAACGLLLYPMAFAQSAADAARLRSIGTNRSPPQSGGTMWHVIEYASFEKCR